jgi:hypothetical protein
VLYLVRRHFAKKAAVKAMQGALHVAQLAVVDHAHEAALNEYTQRGESAEHLEYVMNVTIAHLSTETERRRGDLEAFSQADYGAYVAAMCIFNAAADAARDRADEAFTAAWDERISRLF